MLYENHIFLRGSMKHNLWRFAICAVLGLMVLALNQSSNAQVLLPPPVEVAIPMAPTPVVAGGRAYLVYELHVTNFRATEMTLVRVEAFGPDSTAAPLVSYQDAELTKYLSRPGAPQNLPDKRAIGGGLRAVVYMWVSVDPQAVPTALRHRLTFTVTDASGKSAERVLEGARITVNKEAAIVIGSPLRGGNWVVGNGPSNTSGHRRTLIPLDGQVRIAQRFAIDWLKFGADGKAFHGDSTKNENWYGYGSEVIAVADGIVASAKDGIKENVPLAQPAVPITLETIAGNHIILDLGRGRYALFAHLQPGSLRVKVGERVKRGQVLGLLGNSGNSDAPHLRFHLTNGNSPLGAEGVPYVFESFDLLGATTEEEAITTGWKPKPNESPSNRQKEIPLENVVVRFP